MFKKILLILLTNIIVLPLFSWNNHAGITYLILKDYWKEKSPKSVPAESLESFLKKERQGIPSVLADAELWAKSRLPHLIDINDTLKFKPNENDSDITVKFLKAIRANPNHKTSLYIQKLESRSPSNFALENLTILQDKGKLVNETFLGLKEGEMVDPVDILVTAVDEPDYDLDLYLFEDSGLEQTKIYGFGEQPFGNPKYEYSSQAPFHMGFYHEPSIIFTLAGFLKKTYPEYRIHQFTKLSEFAFRTGHKYWGYRFAGWALHYIQDLTQPYHSSVLPRVSATKQIGVQVISMVGISSPKNNMIEHVTNRHTLIEEYQYYLIKEIIQKRDWEHPVCTSIQLDGKSNVVWDGSLFVRDGVAKEAFNVAEAADEELEKLKLDRYEKLYENAHPIHTILGGLLKNTSKHTRSYLNQFSLD